MKRILFPVALTCLLAAGCGMAGSGQEGETVIENGSQVKMNYTLTVDGEVIDSSKDGEPLAYTQGGGQLIPGLEEQLLGLKVGDTKSCTLPPEKGYGPVDPNAQRSFPRTAFQNSDTLKVGDTVSGQVQGRPFAAKVTAIDEEQVTLDLNHPLAGKTLNFDVEIVDIQAPAAPADAPSGT